jgi:TonB-dependent SusC/RagA subfamily outer membrane receptor
MKKLTYILCVIVLTAMVSCGGLKSKDNTATNTAQVSEANKDLLPLFNQIIRLRGMSGATGVPLFISSNNSVLGTAEPLYVLDGNVIGNSFASIRDVVNPMDVKKIKPVKGADATFYGARGSNGVIVITTE